MKNRVWIASKIWSNRWIPNLSIFLIQSQVKILDKEAIVQELVCEATKGWNIQLVRQIFNEEEATTICKIPLGKFGAADLLVWHIFCNGKFSMKSAYHLEMSILKRQLGECAD